MENRRGSVSSSTTNPYPTPVHNPEDTEHRVARLAAATGTATGIRVSLNTGFTVANSGFDSNAVLPVHGIVLQ